MVRICLIKFLGLCRVSEISRKLSIFSDRGLYTFKIVKAVWYVFVAENYLGVFVSVRLRKLSIIFIKKEIRVEKVNLFNFSQLILIKCSLYIWLVLKFRDWHMPEFHKQIQEKAQIHATFQEVLLHIGF